MGEVIDEDTGQRPSCTICDSAGGCSHLVASIDMTFTECNGGVLYDHIGKLRQIFEDAILARVRSKDDAEVHCTDVAMEEIVMDAIQQYDPEDIDQVTIDERLFLAFLIDALFDAGADEVSGDIVEEGGPGQSSNITLLYAEDPLQVIRVARKVLENAVAKIQ